MPLGFFLHRRARPTADRLLARLRDPCPVLVEVGPPRRPAPAGGATMAALNAWLGAVDRLERLAAGRIVVDGQRMVPAGAGHGIGAGRYGVVTELRTGPAGIAALGEGLAAAAAELGERVHFGYGLGVALPAGDAAPAERIAHLAWLLERAAGGCAEGRRLAVLTRRVEAGGAGRWRAMAASDWLPGALRRRAPGRRDRGGGGRLYVTLVDTQDVANGSEHRAPAWLAECAEALAAVPRHAQPPAVVPAVPFALPASSSPVPRSSSIRCRTASR